MTHAKTPAFARGILLWGLSVSLTLAAFAAPLPTPPILIQGKLTGSTGRPLTGSRAWRVQFYDAASGGSALGAAQTGAAIVGSTGRFSIEVTPPAEALAAATLYYELAIDSAASPDNAIGSADVFPGRVKVASVLSAQKLARQGEGSGLDADKLDGRHASAFVETETLATGLAGKADAAHTHNLEALGGMITDAQAPDTLTINHAATANYATSAGLATLAKYAEAAAEADTLASVTARGAATNNTLELDGGVRAPWIRERDAGAGVNVAGVVARDGTLHLPYAASPGGLGEKLVNTSGSLVWNGAPLMAAQGAAFVIVKSANSPTSNAQNLRQAYRTAKTMRPYGYPLSAINRVAVIVPPGSYNLTGGPLTLDAEYVDLVGLSPAREDQVLTSQINTTGTGTLCQTANDVRIMNLSVSCEYFGPIQFGVAAAYYPSDGTTRTLVRNCEFKANGPGAYSMRVFTAYPGTYEDVKAYGDHTFGSSGGNASGVFRNCTGEQYAFGSGANSKASGKFYNCTGGLSSFGSNHGEANGAFVDCTGGDYSFGGNQGKASGSFIRCTGGRYAFGGSVGEANGVFQDCKGGDSAFGAYYGSASGEFIDCTAGNYSFGASYGFAIGKFTGCIGGTHAFGGNQGKAAGTFINCQGGDYAFGGFYGTVNGTFTGCAGGAYAFGGDYGTLAGTLTNCTGGAHAFGGNNGAYVQCTVNARLIGCHMTGGIWNGSWHGLMDNCRWDANNLRLGAEARIYGVTVRGTLDLANTAAGVAQCRAQQILNAASNRFGVNAFNIASDYVE